VYVLDPISGETPAVWSKYKANAELMDEFGGENYIKKKGLRKYGLGIAW